MASAAGTLALKWATVPARPDLVVPVMLIVSFVPALGSAIDVVDLRSVRVMS